MQSHMTVELVWKRVWMKRYLLVTDSMERRKGGWVAWSYSQKPFLSLTAGRADIRNAIPSSLIHSWPSSVGYQIADDGNRINCRKLDLLFVMLHSIGRKGNSVVVFIVWSWRGRMRRIILVTLIRTGINYYAQLRTYVICWMKMLELNSNRKI